MYFSSLGNSTLKDHHPQQQGLRLFLATSRAAILIGLKDHHPQQQGLRHIARKELSSSVYLKDHHPQQQGLRH